MINKLKGNCLPPTGPHDNPSVQARSREAAPDQEVIPDGDQQGPEAVQEVPGERHLDSADPPLPALLVVPPSNDLLSLLCQGVLPTVSQPTNILMMEGKI